MASYLAKKLLAIYLAILINLLLLLLLLLFLLLLSNLPVKHWKAYAKNTHKPKLYLLFGCFLQILY